MATDAADRPEDLPTCPASLSGWGAVRQAIWEIQQIPWIDDDIEQGLAHLDAQVQAIMQKEGN